jgi:hypothetical protein
MERIGAKSSASGTHGAHETELDRHLPCQAPALLLGERGMDPRRTQARNPDLERHKLYLGRPVLVEGDEGVRRRAFVEAIDACGRDNGPDQQFLQHAHVAKLCQARVTPPG